MKNDVMNLLTAFIEASGYEIKDNGTFINDRKHFPTHEVYYEVVKRKADTCCLDIKGWGSMNNMDKATALQKKINELTK
jgi:hypothetical protein